MGGPQLNNKKTGGLKRVDNAVNAAVKGGPQSPRVDDAKSPRARQLEADMKKATGK